MTGYSVQLCRTAKGRLYGRMFDAYGTGAGCFYVGARELSRFLDCGHLAESIPESTGAQLGNQDDEVLAIRADWSMTVGMPYSDWVKLCESVFPQS